MNTWVYKIAVLWVVVLMSVFQGIASSGGQVLLEATHLEFVGRSYDWSGKGKGKQGVGGENITVTGGLEKIKLRGMILWLFWN